MDDTRVQKIIDDVMATLLEVSDIKGVYDDVPRDYAHPPRPRPTYGEQRLPFAWVFESGEMAASYGEAGNDIMLFRDLTIQTETAFRFNDRDDGLKRTGRSLLGDIQRALAIDHTRSGYAYNCLEGRWAIEDTPHDGIGVVVSEWVITYHRSSTDPTLAGGE